MIEVQALTKRYGAFEAVRDVSFTVGDGQIIGLLGPNGAGKTSIMKVLTGFHRPSGGRALLNGLDVMEEPVALKALVGYLPEGVPLYGDMTVGEYLLFIAEARSLASDARQAALDKAMSACGLSGMADIRIEHLSKGYRQRVGLAQAIIHDPAILILDEPTTGLDPNQILEIRSLIRSLGASKTVILSTHILQEVEALCGEVLILNEGRIVAQGSASKLAQDMQGDERFDALLRGGDRSSLSAFAETQAYAGFALEELGAGKARARFSVRAGRGDEAAEALFGWALAHGASLLELRRDRMSLEEIFVRLTGEERAP
jgi:ABC-2 type transport system ATP-binding protein